MPAAAAIAATTESTWEGFPSDGSTTGAQDTSTQSASHSTASTLANVQRPNSSTTASVAVAGEQDVPVTTALTVSPPEKDAVTLLAEWNGCVRSIGENGFAADLSGVFGDGVSGQNEEAQIPLDDVSNSDMEWLQPGNFFRLCVFYEMGPTGQPRRYTQVVFRRLPAYRDKDLAAAKERAAELHRGLRVE